MFVCVFGIGGSALTVDGRVVSAYKNGTVFQLFSVMLSQGHLCRVVSPREKLTRAVPLGTEDGNVLSTATPGSPVAVALWTKMSR